MESYKTGWVQGLGATLNIQLGWIPDRVTFQNVTDGAPQLTGFPSRLKMAVTSGGTNEIKVGHTIKGVTSKATAKVMAVLLYSGTWAGGNSVGTPILDRDTYVGTFQSENIYYVGSSGTNDAGGAAPTASGYTETNGGFATDTNLTAYLGTEAANSKGFTAASGVVTNNKVFVWHAWRNVS